MAQSQIASIEWLLHWHWTKTQNIYDLFENIVRFSINRSKYGCPTKISGKIIYKNWHFLSIAWKFFTSIDAWAHHIFCWWNFSTQIHTFPNGTSMLARLFYFIKIWKKEKKTILGNSILTVIFPDYCGNNDLCCHFYTIFRQPEQNKSFTQPMSLRLFTCLGSSSSTLLFVRKKVTKFKLFFL